MTMAISASSLRREMALAMASKLDPRPEIRIPSRKSAILHAGTAAPLRGDMSDDPGLFAQPAKFANRPIGLQPGYNEDHADAEVKRLTPVVFGNIADVAKQI